jgi:hypothetical protein
MCWPRWYSRIYPKIGLVSVELIASMSWRRRLCEHSCLPSRHHLYEERRFHTKRRRYTEWDQVISRFGKHCPLRFVY